MIKSLKYDLNQLIKPDSIRLSGILIFYTLNFIHPFAAQAIETEKPKSLKTVILQLKWMHQFQFAGYYVAKEQGFYADEGLEVRIDEFNQDKSTVQQVVSGKANYAIGDIGILFDYARGQPIKALAAIFQHNALIYISKRSSGALSPYEMLGKQVMEQSTATDDTLLRATLTEADISKENYISIKHSFNIEDLISNKVDVMSGYMTDQPFSLSQRDVEINIIKPQNYGIDYLKIDRSFTRNLAPSSNDMILSEAIILMSHKLGLKVIAEGIETEEQLNLLAKAGCDYGQGYWFSMPVSAAEFEALLIKKHSS